MSFNFELRNKIIEDPSLRWVEIYKITNTINNKQYIGQVVSHRKCFNKYYPKGIYGRFKEHMKESIPKQKYHCNALNNAVRTYGVSHFIVELLVCCSLENANEIEAEHIKIYNSLVPNGYNINTSCKTLPQSTQLRTQISIGNVNVHLERHLTKFIGFEFNIEESNFHKLITPRTKHDKQIGWYLRLNRITIEFISAIQPLNDTYKRAFDFLKLLKNRQ